MIEYYLDRKYDEVQPETVPGLQRPDPVTMESFGLRIIHGIR